MSKGSKINVKDYLEGDEIDLSLQTLTSSTLPVKDLALIKKGKKLDLSKNQIITLPDSFLGLVHLVKLDLSSNGLTRLPDTFGRLALLQHLDLFKNNLTALPVGFFKLKVLKWLDVKENPLEYPGPEVVGLCRNDGECRACAAKVVEYMRKENADQEKKKQKKLEQKRAKTEALKRELDHLEELEKIEKKRAKQEEKARDKAKRRAEFEERRKLEGTSSSSPVEESPKREQAPAPAPPPPPLLKIAAVLAAVLLLLGAVLVASVLQPDIGGLRVMTSEAVNTITEALSPWIKSINSCLLATAPNLQKSLVSFTGLLGEMIGICKDTTFMIYELGNEQVSDIRTFIHKSLN